MVYVSRWIDSLLPGTCILCGAHASGALDLCRPCLRDLPWNRNACARCALPLAEELHGICAPCLNEPPAFSGCIAALRYEYPVRQLLAGFKFRAELANGRLLATLLAQCVDQRLGRDARDFRLVPVPLHPVRLRERGFNQAERVARVLALGLGMPLERHLLERRVQTPDQKHLDARARNANLREAFLAHDCAGKRIALIDDVMTTGATARTVSSVLLAAGAREVQLWCLARAI